MEQKHLNRWVYAIMGVLVLLFAGLVYGWTTFSKPLNAIWTPSALTWTSTIVMAFFCLGGFFGGQMQKKGVNIKVNLTLGAILMFAGFTIAGFLGDATQSIIVIYLGFGVLGGLGAGFAYNAVLSAVSGWFPDKQGLISGVLLMGFGIGSFIMGLIYASVVNPMTSEESTGLPWSTCFFGIGILCLIIILLGAILLKKPAPGYTVAGAENSKKQKSAPYEDVDTAHMLKRSSFWFMFIWAILVSVAGLAVVFLGTPIATAAVPTLNDAPSTLAIIVGLVSIFNGVGRIIFGGMFDKIGYKPTLLIVCGMFIISMGIIILAMVTGSMLILIISYIVTGLSYGGVTPSQSAFVNKFYGAKYYAVNLPLMTMNLLIASFGTKLVNAVQTGLETGGMTKTGSYIVVLAGVAVICLIAAVFAIMIKKPKTAGN
ncbi:MAG: MFS transporter [Parasporobacterium sp.]|nr:MFS transporter [Parasporobacterium sp.]